MSTPPLQRVPASASPDSYIDILDSDGAVIIEGMVDAQTIGQLSTDIQAHAKGLVPGASTYGVDGDYADFSGEKTIRFSGLGKVSDAFFDLLANEPFIRICDHFLLPNCGTYWMNTASAILIGPGETPQVLHRDCFNWFQFCMPLWPDAPEITISSIIALDDVTEEMGATRVIPGSHKFEGAKRQYDMSETVPAEMQAGDALVYSGKVVHCGGQNRTENRWRNAMHLSHVVGWLVPEEASTLNFTTEEMREQSPLVQQLLGFRSYEPRPLIGSGLWLKNINKIEDEYGYR